jgi:extracellular solute-binding protein
MFATICAWLEVIGYNTNLVKHEDAPKGYADLLDPKWRGKLVKAHPSYSGAILTVTYLLVRELGWSYLEKLGQQRVMQVQSAADPPKKIQIGERAVMTEGNDYNLALLKAQGQPVEAVNPVEGSPLIVVSCGIFRNAPNPNAARLFQHFMFGAEAQKITGNFAKLSLFTVGLTLVEVKLHNGFNILRRFPIFFGTGNLFRGTGNCLAPEEFLAQALSPERAWRIGEHACNPTPSKPMPPGRGTVPMRRIGGTMRSECTASGKTACNAMVIRVMRYSPLCQENLFNKY